MYAKSFTKVYASSSWTLPSMVALFSGTYPFVRDPLSIRGRIHLVRILNRYNCKTLVINSGNTFLDISYLIEGFNKRVQLASSTLFKNITPLDAVKKALREMVRGPSTLINAFNLLYVIRDLYETIMYEKYPYVTFDKITAILKKLKELKSKKHVFLYIHVMDCHHPWRVLPLFKDNLPSIFFATSLMYFNTLALSHKSLKTIRKVYELSLHKLMKEIIDLLLEIDSLIDDDFVIIITADHGEGFGLQRYDRFHEIYLPNKRVYTLYHDQLHIPLVIFTNNAKMEEKLRPVKDDILVSNIDILPSIIDLAYEDALDRINKYINGVSIFRLREQGRNCVLAETPAYRIGLRWYGKAYTIIDRTRYKLTLHPLLGKKLTDIIKDPYEVNHLEDTLLLKDLYIKAKNAFWAEKRLNVLLKLSGIVKHLGVK